jgi:hypothetical protein
LGQRGGDLRLAAISGTWSPIDQAHFKQKAWPKLKSNINAGSTTANGATGRGNLVANESPNG